MTRDDIIRMAREAGFETGTALCEVVVRHSNGSWVGINAELIEFAALVAAAERNRIARAALTPAPTESAEDDDLYWRLHAMSKSLEGAGRLDEHDNPDAYGTVLDAMNFVKQHSGQRGEE
ncbi:MAG: hypothetical protein ACRCTX_24505 [Afipia sp.]